MVNFSIVSILGSAVMETHGTAVNRFSETVDWSLSSLILQGEHWTHMYTFSFVRSYWFLTGSIWTFSFICWLNHVLSKRKRNGCTVFLPFAPWETNFELKLNLLFIYQLPDLRTEAKNHEDDTTSRRARFVKFDTNTITHKLHNGFLWNLSFQFVMVLNLRVWWLRFVLWWLLQNLPSSWITFFSESLMNRSNNNNNNNFAAFVNICVIYHSFPLICFAHAWT